MHFVSQFYIVKEYSSLGEIMAGKKISENKKKKKSMKKKKCKGMVVVKRGKGFVDKIIDHMPFELHVPKYQFCGPGDYKLHL